MLRDVVLGNMKEIIHADAITWLEAYEPNPEHIFFVSLPDYSEFPHLTIDEWKSWFIETAELIMKKTHPDQYCLFFQSDIKYEGEWIDKGYLIQKAAERLHMKTMWHKIVMRAPLGSVTFGRPSYSHLLSFSMNQTRDSAQSAVDIFYESGEKTWARGIGEKTAEFIINDIRKNSPGSTLINPFCGEGLLLKVADSNGIPSIGIERSLKRVKIASKL